MSNTTVASDPIASFSVGIDIPGGITGFFTEVSGVGITTEVIEQWGNTPEGKNYQRKIPGKTTYDDIVLKRGVVADNKETFDWAKMVADGQVVQARKNGSIILYDQALKEVARWNFEAAWPSKVVLPSLSAESASGVIEEITIVVEKIERAS